MDSYVQIGVAVMRDTVTGEPLKARIPIYAKSKATAQASGINRGEQKILTDVAGVFVDIFRKYNDEIKKIKSMEDIPK